MVCQADRTGGCLRCVGSARCVRCAAAASAVVAEPGGRARRARHRRPGGERSVKSSARGNGESRLLNPDTLATIAHVAVWAFAIVVAVNQLGIATTLINTLLIGV